MEDKHLTEVKEMLKEAQISYSVLPSQPFRLYIQHCDTTVDVSGSPWRPEYWVNDTRCQKARIVPLIEQGGCERV